MVQFDDRLHTNKRLAQYQQDAEERYLKMRAAQVGIPYINLFGASLNPEAIALIPETRAREAEAVAFAKTYRSLSLAVRNPDAEEARALIDELAENYEVKVFLTSRQSLVHAWKRYASQSTTRTVKKGVLNIDPDEIRELSKTLTDRRKVARALAEMHSVNIAQRITRTVDTIFAGALASGASDIHIEPEQGEVRIRYRLDGVLHEVTDIPRELYTRLTSRIKLLAGMLLNVTDEAQDGRFTFSLPEKTIEVRASVIPGAYGESIVVRLLDPTVASFSMDQLGLNSALEQTIRTALERPNGMILTTGPTGSGKTTALYAFMREVHTPEVKIITIENPVEYMLEGIVQTQVDDEYTFATGLRSILRQDPDVIMVGEIRDPDVAATAIQAAQTGHLVFSTLHTNNAAGAFARLIDLGVQTRLIGAAVNLVLGQRLVRVLCDKCKTPYRASQEEVQLITDILRGHPQPPTLQEPLTLYCAAGCEQCDHTGFTGRCGVFEGIVVDHAVEDAVVNDQREHTILRASAHQKIPTMTEDAIAKVVAGTTSLEEAKRVVDITRIRTYNEAEA